MLHKANHSIPSLPKECFSSTDCPSVFKPLSYYLNGGIDLTGESLDKSAQVEYDNEDDLKELNEEGAMSVPYGDPRESKFSLVERYGVDYAQKVSAKSAKPVATQTTGDE